MKLKYISLLSLLLVFTACPDFLEPDIRSDESADKFYKTEVGFESLTNATYSSLRVVYNNWPLVFSAGTDLYGDGKNQGIVLNHYNALDASESLVRDLYSACFKGIQLANTVIYYGKHTEASPVREQYVDEARFIRAWYYFQLVQQFGEVTLQRKMFDYAEMSHERTDLKELYNFIIDEFTYLASNSSKLLERTKSNVGRANKRAAAFFLAKTHLTRAWLNGQDYEKLEDNIAQADDYTKAATFALQAIEEELPSLSIDEAFDINNENNTELFWSVQYSYASIENPVSSGSYQQAQFGCYLGGSEFPLNKAMDGNLAPFLRLHQLFSKGDGRYEQTFMTEFHQNYFDYYTEPTSSPIIYYYPPAWATNSDIAAWQADDPHGLKANAIVSKTIAEGGIAPSNGKEASYSNRRTMDFGVSCVKKFDDYTATALSNRSQGCSMHDVVVARLGEAYLIAAEAYVQNGQANQAADMINKLRARPGTMKAGFEEDMTVAASDMTIDFILDERARELAGEYVRWTDLKRTHKLIEYVLAYNEDNVTENNMKGDDGNYKILRPIPQIALDRNQNKVIQNPGY
ncbi:MAG: RagB/SusD family nutrient uptake outer membrane protein [Bacteroidales bacterium]